MKVIKCILLITLLVACGAKDKEMEEINNRDCIIEIKQEEIKYKTVDENIEPVELYDKEFEIITEGKDGYRDIVYCDNEEITYWTYEDPIHKVVKLKEELETVEVEEDTDSTSDNQSNGGNSQSNNHNNSVKPPINNDGDTTPPKPTEPEKPVEPTPPVDKCAVYPGNDGNGWWPDRLSAKYWADSQALNEDSSFYLQSFDVIQSDHGCGWYIVFRD